jgi:hypothetical protein
VVLVIVVVVLFVRLVEVGLNFELVPGLTIELISCDVLDTRTESPVSRVVVACSIGTAVAGVEYPASVE